MFGDSMKLIRLFVRTIMILCLSASFSYAQSTREYKSHEVIELTDGLKVEVLRSRGEGDAKEWDVIYYKEKRQTGKRMWQLASVLQEEENQALLSRGIKPPAPKPIATAPIEQPKKEAVVKSEPTATEKGSSDLKMPQTFKSTVPKNMFKTLPSTISDTTKDITVTKVDTSIAKPLVTKSSRRGRAKKTTIADSTAISPIVKQEAGNTKAVNPAEIKKDDTTALKPIMVKGRRNNKVVAPAIKDSSASKAIVTTGSKRGRVKKQAISNDSTSTVSVVKSDVAKDKIAKTMEIKAVDTSSSKPIVAKGRYNSKRKSAEIKPDSIISKPVARRLSNREKIRLADSLIAAQEAAIKPKPTTSIPPTLATDTLKTSTVGIFSVKISTLNIVREKPVDTVTPQPVVVISVVPEQVKVVEVIAEDTVSETVTKPYDNIVVPPPTADEKKEAAILSAKAAVAEDTTARTVDAIQQEASADTTTTNAPKRRRYTRHTSQARKANSTQKNVATKPVAKKPEVKRK
jgi:hypothetical protein